MTDLKTKGIVIDTEIEEHMSLLGIEMDDDEEFLELQQEEICRRQDELEKVTKRYMCGQDDGKFFIFSDDEEALDAISTLFPGFELEEHDLENFPLDYDYRQAG